MVSCKILSLQSPHNRSTKLRGKIGIFSVGFLRPPPSRVAGKIQHRRQHLMYIFCAGLCRNHPSHILTQCRFKCTGKGQLLRKDRCVTAMQPVQGLLMEQKRNSQACMFFCIFLQCIINSCISPSFFQFFQAFPAHRFFDFFPINPHNIRIELIQFFFHCHLRQQLFDMCLYRFFAFHLRLSPFCSLLYDKKSL